MYRQHKTSLVNVANKPKKKAKNLKILFCVTF